MNSATRIVLPGTLLMRTALRGSRSGNKQWKIDNNGLQVRTAVTKPTGEFLPEPKRVPLGIAGVGGTVAVGLLLGAAISKNIASFLEENELFVPSDDDDDD